MRSKFFLMRSLLLTVIIITAINWSNAQTKQDSPDLYKEIAHMDSVLFDAVNTRNLEKLKTLFTDDLEFYHDLSGLTGYQKNMESFKNNFEKNNGLRRELVQGSLEVYPIKDFGAMQIGSHTFCHPENGKLDCGTFKFVHIWQKKDGQWKISRVISYGH
ncbi:MAG: nuclear transport factor 2 family protein [Ferruginibacter sp.]|nr:nuclear transport factor 2 family protein [Chitinophagaceae bacterium]